MNDSTHGEKLNLMKYPARPVLVFAVANRRYVPEETYDYYADIMEHNEAVYLERIRELEDITLTENKETPGMDYPDCMTYKIGDRSYVPEESFDHYADIIKYNTECLMKRIRELEDIIFSE